MRWSLNPSEIERFAAEPVVLAVYHPHYPHGATLSDLTRAEFLADLRG